MPHVAVSAMKHEPLLHCASAVQLLPSASEPLNLHASGVLLVRMSSHDVLYATERQLFTEMSVAP